MGLFSALTITSIISSLALMIMIPPSEIDRALDGYFKSRPHHKADDWVVVLYLIIIALTVMLVSAYTVFKAYEDRNRRLGILSESEIARFSFW